MPITSNRRGAYLVVCLNPTIQRTLVFETIAKAEVNRSSEYRVDVSGLLQPGENRIRIVVANLAINQLAKGPLPDYQALIAKYGERFQPQDMANLRPQPSGLLQPVRLVAR